METPHPDLRLDETPFYFCKKSRPWIQGSHPRRAGVSAFGFGGSNFHFILEEHQSETGSYRLNLAPQPVLLTAENPVKLQKLCQEFLNQFTKSPEESHRDLIKRGNQKGPPSIEHARLGFVTGSPQESIQALELGELELCLDKLGELDKVMEKMKRRI